MTKTQMNIKIASALFFLPLLLSSSPVYATLPWNMDFVTDDGTINANITTDGSGTPQTNTVYTIQGISGTYTNISGGTQSITGLSSLNNADNTIEWDGTKSSPVLVNTNGISFTTSGSNFFNIFSLASLSNTHYFQADTVSSSTPATIVSSSKLSVVPFEFSPEQGFILGIPSFLVLRKLKKIGKRN